MPLSFHDDMNRFWFFDGFKVFKIRFYMNGVLFPEFPVELSGLLMIFDLVNEFIKL